MLACLFLRVCCGRGARWRESSTVRCSLPASHCLCHAHWVVRLNAPQVIRPHLCRHRRAADVVSERY